MVWEWYRRGLPVCCVLVGLCVWLGCKDREQTARQYQTPKQPAPTSISPTPVPTPQDTSQGGYRWTAPAGWQEQPGTGMRLATFKVTLGERQAECSVIELAGMAGGLVANVNRWRGQVGLPAVSEGEIEAAAIAQTGALGDYQYFRIVNEKAPDEAFLVAILSLTDKTLFVKLMATASDCGALEPAFVSYCSSITAR